MFSQILEDYAKKMRDAENESHEGKRKAESLWPIMRISHARSRYIYELYYKREAISRELYDWLLKEGYADAKYVSVCNRTTCLITIFYSLVAKWKKSGYEKLCCLRCIQTRECAILVAVFKCSSLTHLDIGHKLPRFDVHLQSA